MSRPPRNVETRRVFYQRNVDLGIEPECHECVSHSVNSKGYISFGRDGFYLLHRWVYWQCTGESPEVVMHLCDNKVCLNPLHLVAGTYAENNSDRDDKRRCRSGSGTSLSDNVVRAIREAEGTQQEIADNLGVSRTIVSRIKRRISYSYVS